MIRLLIVVSGSVQSLPCPLVEIKSSENQRPLIREPKMVGREEHILYVESLGVMDGWANTTSTPWSCTHVFSYRGAGLCISHWLNCTYCILEDSTPVLQSINPEFVSQLNFNRMLYNSFSLSCFWVSLSSPRTFPQSCC